MKNDTKQIQIIAWNIPRNGLKFNQDLEAQMLSEESTEFFDGMKDFTGIERCIEMVDAYCDFIFVLRGTQAKALATTFDNAQDYRNAISLVEGATQMGFMLLEVLNKAYPWIDGYDLDTCLQYVITANAKKPIKKTGEKVSKGADWVDPKAQIEAYLFDDGEELTNE